MKKENIIYSNPTPVDSLEIVNLESRVWGRDHAISNETSRQRIELFPEGSFVARVDGKIIGSITTVLINIPNFSANKLRKMNKSWYDYSGNGDIRKTYDETGNVLFGVSLTVDTKFGGRGIGTELMLCVAEYAISKNIRAVFLGGRLPYYYKKKDVPIGQYMKLRNSDGKLFDPELRFYSRSGLRILCPVKDYYKDEESLNYGVILLWMNPFYYLGRIPFLGRLINKVLFKIFAIIKSR